MKDNKISFRPEGQVQQPMILSMVYAMLDAFELDHNDNRSPSIDVHTINAIRASLKIFNGWDEIFLNNAFQLGISIGSDPNRPEGLLNKDVYSYVDDFFIATPESNENK
jgi:hypothetical protein